MLLVFIPVTVVVLLKTSCAIFSKKQYQYCEGSYLSLPMSLRKYRTIFKSVLVTMVISSVRRMTQLHSTSTQHVKVPSVTVNIDFLK